MFPSPLKYHFCLLSSYLRYIDIFGPALPGIAKVCSFRFWWEPALPGSKEVGPSRNALSGIVKSGSGKTTFPDIREKRPWYIRSQLFHLQYRTAEAGSCG